MAYWLFKTEPSTFSIDDLAHANNQQTAWEGVRNYQARNFMRDEMQVGDEGFFYHSSCAEPGIFGIVKIVKKAYPDASAWNPKSDYFDPKSTPENPRWFMVDVKLIKQFAQPILLSELRENPRVKSLRILQKGNRLSITPVTILEWHDVIRMG